jgi:tetratricopeptide (TPR) repeat protein
MPALLNTPAPAPARWRGARAALAAAALVLLGALVLRPVLAGGWLWDDEREVTENRILRDPAGLRAIWLAPAGPDYFPLKSSAQWLEWRAWGARPAGYHAVSLALHLASALLLWRILRRLGVRWGWVGGLLFAVHPLAVESVAWAAELKNTLSLPLLLLALDAWLDWDEAARPGAYARALLFFLAALLAKSSVVMLPAVLLLHAWWKRGRIAARDGAATAPFFAVALVLGLVTLRFQQRVAIGGWTIAAGAPAARLGRAVLASGFYFLKAVAPSGLSALYSPAVVAPSPLHLLPVLALLALAAWFWAYRASWGRHGLFALGFFILNLLPTIGLVSMSYMRYSWVADHFAYIALIGVVGLGAAALSALGQTQPVCAGLAAAVLASLLACESNRYARVFHDSAALWSHVLQRDPGSWTAEDHLGEVDLQAGRSLSAVAHYSAAVRLAPGVPEAHSSLGYALLLSERPAESIGELREAIRLGYGKAHTNLGNALAQIGDVPGAIAEQRLALQAQPDSPDVEVNLANALTQAGRVPEALPHYERALRLDSDFSEGRYNWAIALVQAGRTADAAVQLARAAQEAPQNARIWNEWGAVLARAGDLPGAAERFARAAQVDPNSADYQANLGAVLLEENRPREAIPPLEAAVRLNPGLAVARQNLTVARWRAAQP